MAPRSASTRCRSGTKDGQAGQGANSDRFAEQCTHEGGVDTGKETPVSDVTLKYPLWQNHYLQAMAETRPELLKSKISAAEQVVSLRLRQLASITDDYEEQIALAAAQKSLKVLKER